MGRGCRVGDVQTCVGDVTMCAHVTMYGDVKEQRRCVHAVAFQVRMALSYTILSHLCLSITFATTTHTHYKHIITDAPFTPLCGVLTQGHSSHTQG